MSNVTKITFLVVFFALFYRCASEATSDTLGEELTLAEKYQSACGNCHALPSPQDLPKNVWANIVLPRMGNFLGFYGSATEREELLLADAIARDRLEQANIFPALPTISVQEWDEIRNFVLSQAPDTLAYSPQATGTEANLIPVYPDFFLSPPSGTYLNIPDGGGVLLGDVNKQSLFALDSRLSPKQQVEVGVGLTDIQTGKDGTFGTLLGSFSPTDAGLGSVIKFSARGPVVVAKELRRPTSLLLINLDDDPEDELVVTEFGKWTGGLSRWDLDGDSYQRTDLSAQSGAMQVVGLDASTFLVLYAQGREEVKRYTRAPGGELSVESVLRFPPSWGSSSMRLVDWNQDGIQDILYTCGDAADYRSDPKPYHGVRVYTGDSKGNYSEAGFWPLPGAYDAEVGDFDGDGEQEIAAVSFFPDYTLAEPLSAVLFDRDQQGNWITRTLKGAQQGRFIRLAAGDVDGDGKLDLAASTLAMEPVPDNGRLASWIEQGLPVLVWLGK